MLSADGISVSYGAIRALDSASFVVWPREIVAFVGPNGAGKSTALKAVSGTLAGAGGVLSQGTITYLDNRIEGSRTDALAKLGLCLIPEGRRVFSSLSVRENLEMGAYCRNDRAEIAQDMASVYGLFPRLHDRHSQRAGTLSGGEQQMLAIGRALMLRPKLLMADEPLLGLSPEYKKIISRAFLDIKDSGTSIILVEQKAVEALQVCDRAYLFVGGRITQQGTSSEFLNEGKLRHALFAG